MKVMKIALLCLLLALMSAAALADVQLPGVDVFSPGLVRLAEKMEDSPAVHMEAGLTISDAFYVRDTSVLSAMLEGTTLIYDGAALEGGYAEQLTITRGDATLYESAADGTSLMIGGEVFPIDEQSTPMQPLIDFVQTTAILERAPLALVEQFLLSLEAGTELFAGYRIEEPFTSVQTLSDDGTRLVRINIQGSIAREGEAPWVIKGYLKQPAGRAPKDTFELTARQDDKNYLELSYSSTRQSEITKKNKAGKASVDTHLKIAGAIGGYSVSERLTSYLRNTWTADGEKLDEKIVVNMTLTHSDNTPGREMQRMNRAEAKMRHDIRMTTAHEGSEEIALSDTITLSLVMDDNTVLDAQANTTMRIGGEGAKIALPADQNAGETTLEEAFDRAMREMAAKIYVQLPEKIRAKTTDGLE